MLFVQPLLKNIHDYTKYLFTNAKIKKFNFVKPLALFNFSNTFDDFIEIILTIDLGYSLILFFGFIMALVFVLIRAPSGQQAGWVVKL